MNRNAKSDKKESKMDSQLKRKQNGVFKETLFMRTAQTQFVNEAIPCEAGNETARQG